MSVVVRTTGDALAVAGPIRDLVRSIDPDLPIVWMRTMDDIASASVARPRFLMTLMSVFAAAALLLGAIGVYGVISHGVAQRTSEIGVRMALGAGRQGVLAQVLRRFLAVAAVGILLGMGAALGASRILSSLLYQVSATDPTTFVGVGALLTLVALGAVLVPAIRASRIEPARVLKQE
jgi:putative ABC transport system permease protein